MSNATTNLLKALKVDYISTEQANMLDGSNDNHCRVINSLIDGGEKIKVPVCITPELAESLLERNTKNIRALNKKRVKEDLAPAITAGNWVPLNAHIAFDEDGLLKNGQHTLSAVVDAGEPIEAWVECGITKEREMVIDNHSPRRSHHAIEGMNAYGQAAVKSLAEFGVNGVIDTNTHSMAHYWETIGEKVTTVLGILGEFVGGKRPPGTAQVHAALVAALVNGTSEEDIRRFAAEAYGTDGTWIQAANMVKALGSAYYRGYTAKAKKRQYRLVLNVLENYLQGDDTPSAPSTQDVDRYPVRDRWPVKF